MRGECKSMRMVRSMSQGRSQDESKSKDESAAGTSPINTNRHCVQ